MTQRKPHIYKIIYHDRGNVFEIFARQVSQGQLLGFVEVEELLFQDSDRLVVDPSVERLEREFAGVRRTFLPMHAVVRIDEVEGPGTARIHAAEGDNLRPFPIPQISPRPEPAR